MFWMFLSINILIVVPRMIYKSKRHEWKEEFYFVIAVCFILLIFPIRLGAITYNRLIEKREVCSAMLNRIPVLKSERLELVGQGFSEDHCEMGSYTNQIESVRSSAIMFNAELKKAKRAKRSIPHWIFSVSAFVDDKILEIEEL